MTRSGGARSPSALPSSSRVSGAAAPPRSGRPLLRRRLRNPAFAGRRLGGGGAVDGGAAGGRRSGPTTPFVRWKYNDADLSGKVPARSEVAGVKVRRKSKVSAATATVAAAAAAASSGVLSGTVSARKLAAGIWQLQLPEFSAPVNCSTSATVRSSGRLLLPPSLPRPRSPNLQKFLSPIGCPRSSFLGFPELPELRVSVMPSISFRA
ncbi:unnamed protein product [Spirodela intermedia]|uniref:Uncharacterized protein n=1 Tax=Spirodela intermedia TaxID=51605 RepID=A0A7I8LGF0_SPIIN|nr:unnamed protein product [Spirodela intermedia]